MNKKLTIAYRPNNCVHNLNRVFVRQANDTVSIVRNTFANPPVTGKFSLNYGDQLISGIF